MEKNRSCPAPGVAPAPGSRKWRRRPRVRLLVALLCAGGVIAIYAPTVVNAIRYRFVPKRWGVVEEGRIFRSGQISRTLVKKTLAAHGIQTVVDLTFDSPSEIDHEAELAAIAELGIERKLCPLEADGTGDPRIYAAAVAAVAQAERAGRPVLVHCAAGTQRTGGVIALYRLLVQQKSPEFTFAEMKQYRYDPVHSPKLLRYLNGHMDEIAAELVRLGVIAAPPRPLPVLAAGEARSRG